MAHKVNLKFDQGATFDQTYTWKAGTSAETAVPVDLTGCKARSQIRSDIDSNEVLLEMTTENGRLTLGGVAGTIRYLVSAADTAAFTWGCGVHDLEVEFPDGTVVRRIAGNASVSPEVTRD